VKSVKPDLLDEHFYMPAQESFARPATTTRPTARDRRFLWASGRRARATPTPNLEAALGDAAWMTGMERNADLIVMASYAPLFVNVNPGGMQWATDLIGYDALSSYGSPSYWAQVLFGKYLGTEAVYRDTGQRRPAGFASATRDEKQRKLFVKVVNATSDEAPLTIALKGVGRVKRDAMLITLSGKTPNAYQQHHASRCGGAGGAQD
jgi:alpha-N-arabinofuranosidase